MIALLTGRVEQLVEGSCVLDVNGVGYLVQASTRTLAALPQPPAAARLLIETHVREDAILLYGFADPAERDWFRLLTTVQGVGAKVALSVLSALSPRDLVGAIAAGDRANLTRAPGGRRFGLRPGITSAIPRAGSGARASADAASGVPPGGPISGGWPGPPSRGVLVHGLLAALPGRPARPRSSRHARW
jgi:holliday junction DNA helicase RuvA